MSPDPTASGHLVLVQNVFPKATATSSFSDKVDYVFELRQFSSLAPPTLDPTVLDVKCTFDTGTPQNGTCVTSGNNGTTALSKTVAVGAAGACAGTDKICVYAGLRSDPFFFDLQAFKASVNANMSKFTSPGINFFAGLNVLSIVVEVDVTSAFGPGLLAQGAKPALTIAAKTNRRN